MLPGGTTAVIVYTHGVASSIGSMIATQATMASHPIERMIHVQTAACATVRTLILARLIDGEGENGDAALVELPAPGLLDRRPQPATARVFDRLHGARSLDELQQTLELADALGVFVGRKYLRTPASTEPEDRKDQQAVEDLVTVLVEE